MQLNEISTLLSACSNEVTKLKFVTVSDADLLVKGRDSKLLLEDKLKIGKSQIKKFSEYLGSINVKYSDIKQMNGEPPADPDAPVKEPWWTHTEVPNLVKHRSKNSYYVMITVDLQDIHSTKFIDNISQEEIHKALLLEFMPKESLGKRYQVRTIGVENIMSMVRV